MKFNPGVFKDAGKFLVGFIKETRTETKKVVWPGKQYVIAATIIVLFIVILSGLYVTIIDWVFVKFFKILMRV